MVLLQLVGVSVRQLHQGCGQVSPSEKTLYVNLHAALEVLPELFYAANLVGLGRGRALHVYVVPQSIETLCHATTLV